MNILDWVLVVVVLAYAVSGYWQGFISGAFSTAGLLGGGFIGVFWAVPRLLGDLGPSIWVSLGALFIVLFCASVGQGLLQFVGGEIRDRIRWHPVRAVDAVGGAALSVAAVLVVAWVLGVAVNGAPLSTITQQVRTSEILSRVDGVMPERADRALRSFNQVVGSSVFPQYLEPFAPERIVEVSPPPPGIGRDPDVQAAEASVLKIRGDNGCGRGVEGSGFVYAPRRVMTNAHVVAGVDEPSVLVDDEELPATVVHYDEGLDIAVLAVSGLDRPTLAFDTSGGSGDVAAVLGFPNDGPYDVQAARIRDRQRLRSPDIYGGGVVVREVFSLRALVRPGNSGGPLVSEDGGVLGMIFAASVTDQETGYALTADQVASSAARGLGTRRPVDTGQCA